MSVQTMYADRKMSAEEAIRFIKDGDTVVVPTAAAEAPTIQAAIGVHRRNYNNVAISQLLPMRKFEYFDPETVANVRTETYFASPVSRGPIHEGWADFIPNYFLEIPDLMDRKLIKSDVLVTLASPMDEHGYFSLSLSTDYAMAAARNARAVLLEVNPNVPYAFGDNKIHISQVTAVVENDDPVIEVGLPYSDPVMDGPVIQAAASIALNNGETIKRVFEAVETVANAGGVPLIMSYWNLVYHYGVERFARDFENAGGAGLITPDLIPDEAGEWIEASDRHGLDRIFLVSPDSSTERLETVARNARGFVYAAARMGVTGERATIDASPELLVERTRQAGAENVCVGIGVSTAEQGAKVGSYADGVIVGSALVHTLLADDNKTARDPKEGLKLLAAKSEELAEGIHNAR